MTLVNLQTALDGAKTDTDIQMVIFDFLHYANLKNTDKIYPLIVWDLDNLTGTKNLRGGAEITGKLSVDMYCMNLVTPESDMKELKLPIWDEMEADMLAYLTNVSGLSNVGIPSLAEVAFEYYPAGMLSMERELGVVYKGIQLELWC